MSKNFSSNEKAAEATHSGKPTKGQTPASYLHGSHSDIAKMLADKGVHVTRNKIGEFVRYLSEFNPTARVLTSEAKGVNE